MHIHVHPQVTTYFTLERILHLILPHSYAITVETSGCLGGPVLTRDFRP